MHNLALQKERNGARLALGPRPENGATRRRSANIDTRLVRKTCKNSPMRLALYQPDIPQNVGAAIRVAACFGAELDIIEPCGFPLKAREIKRVAMDYGSLVEPSIHGSWSAFAHAQQSSRMILLTTKSDEAIWDFSFQPDDTLIMGRESAGAPDEIHSQVDARLTIPLAPDARSLNVVVAAGVALAEARRQLGWPQSPTENGDKGRGS